MDNVQKKRRTTLLAVIVIVIIIIGAVFSIININNTSKENSLIIEKCFENFDDKEKITVTFEGNKARCIEELE